MGIRKKLRLASLIMLIAAIIFMIFAVLSMGVPIHLPTWLFRTLQVTYKVYPVVMVLLFAASFFVKDKK